MGATPQVLYPDTKLCKIINYQYCYGLPHVLRVVSKDGERCGCGKRAAMGHAPTTTPRRPRPAFLARPPPAPGRRHGIRPYSWCMHVHENAKPFGKRCKRGHAPMLRAPAVVKPSAQGLARNSIHTCCPCPAAAPAAATILHDVLVNGLPESVFNNHQPIMVDDGAYMVQSLCSVQGVCTIWRPQVLEFPELDLRADIAVRRGSAHACMHDAPWAPAHAPARARCAWPPRACMHAVSFPLSLPEGQGLRAGHVVAAEPTWDRGLRDRGVPVWLSQCEAGCMPAPPQWCARACACGACRCVARRWTRRCASS